MSENRSNRHHRARVVVLVQFGERSALSIRR